MHIDTWIADHKFEKLYLACPYSHPLKMIENYRHKQANIYAGYLMRMGMILYSPISHTHPICRVSKLPGSFAYWKRLDEFFMSNLNTMIVLGIKGWDISTGVKAELIYFNEKRRDRFLWDPKDDSVELL